MKKNKHHKGKHGKGKKGKCRGTVISSHLPKDYEPSDLVWDKPSSTLFVVSDSGRFAGVDIDGKVKGEWKLGDGFDLEGVALVPWRRDTVYLGQENPPSILEYHLPTSNITRHWNLTAAADKDKNRCNAFASTVKPQGIESLVFIQSRNSPNGGYFYAGRQCDARVFVYDVPIEDGNDGELVYRGYLDPPGSGYDLAALTAYNEILYLVYDTDKRVHALDLTDSKLIPPPLTEQPGNVSKPDWKVDATKMDAADYDLVFEREGQEGMTFAEVRGTQHATFVFIAVDPKGKKGKAVVRHEMRKFWDCFEKKDGKWVAKDGDDDDEDDKDKEEEDE